MSSTFKRRWNKVMRWMTWTDDGWRCRTCKQSGGVWWGAFHFHEGPRFSIPPTDSKEL